MGFAHPLIVARDGVSCRAPLGVMMKYLLIFLCGLLAQSSYGRTPPPTPVEDWVRQAEVEIVVVGKLVEVSTRTLSITDWTIQPPRTRYYDFGTVRVETSLKGNVNGGISIQILFRSNSKATGPPLHSVGREGVWLLGRDHLSQGPLTLLGVWDLRYLPQIQKALSQESK